MVFGLVVNLGLLVWLAQFLTPYMLIATFSYSLLLWGFLQRRNRNMHVPLMNAGIAIDIFLVLLLELQRDAIGTAMGFGLNPFQQGHIAASTVALVLYFPLLWLGWRLHLGKTQSMKTKEWHKRMGIAAFAFRSIGFLLMFSLLEHVAK
jgi:hypothetical protein